MQDITTKRTKVIDIFLIRLTDIYSFQITKISIGISAKKLQKCSGYSVELPGQFYDFFPTWRLKELTNLVLENSKLHHISCEENNYLIFHSEPDGCNINICCSRENVLKNNFLKGMLDNVSKRDYHLTHAGNQYLNFKQLQSRIEHNRNVLQTTRLTTLNMVRKLGCLNTTLELHKRFMLLIKENNIHKLHHIVKVALDNNRSIQYIISKMCDAIDGLYKCTHSQEDKDTAQLVMHYGGPALLTILHRALHLPSTSTIYRMRSKYRDIRTDLNVDFSLVVKENFTMDEIEELPMRGYMLKMDETFINANMRWNSKDNLAYGACYEHGRGMNMEINTMEDITKLKQLCDNGELHVPKSCQVTMISCNARKAKGHVVMVLPTCSKSDSTVQREMIESISQGFVDEHGVPLLNWATDGDGTRRIIFNGLSKHHLNPSSPIYPIISKCYLLDQTAGQHEETTDFDAKHLVKRIKYHITGENFRIGDTSFSQADVRAILEAATIRPSQKSVDQIINHGDKQNVAVATELLLLFVNVCSNEQLITGLGVKFGFCITELQLLSLVFDGVLTQYCYVIDDIGEQIKKISSASHALFTLYKLTDKKILTHQLYHDLQSSFQDKIFTAAKWKVYYPNYPCYFVLMGTDVLERFFGNLRARFMNSSMDALEFINALRSISIANDILTERPELVRKSKHNMKRLALDYSSITSWNAEKMVLKDVDVVACWNVGRVRVEVILLESKYSDFDFKKEVDAKLTMLHPVKEGKDVGVRMDCSFEADEPGITDLCAGSRLLINNVEGVTEQTTQSDSQENVDTNINGDETLADRISEKHDPQLEINGTLVYKATAMKGTFGTNQLSLDRLRRVQGLSKNPSPSETMSEIISELTDVIRPGDPILIQENPVSRIGIIRQIFIQEQRVYKIKTTDLQAADILFVPLTVKDSEDGKFYVFDTKVAGRNLEKCSGKLTFPISPDPVQQGDKVLYVMEKSFLHDVGLSITSKVNESEPQGSIELTKDSIINCKICRKKLKLLSMREHVGRHILNNSLGRDQTVDICGFCGMDCKSTLVKTSTSGTSTFFRIQSACPYIYVTKNHKNRSVRNKCTNTVLRCSFCEAELWKYNMKLHFHMNHSEIALPTQYGICQDEVKSLKSNS